MESCFPVPNMNSNNENSGNALQDKYADTIARLHAMEKGVSATQTPRIKRISYVHNVAAGFAAPSMIVSDGCAESIR